MDEEQPLPPLQSLSHQSDIQFDILSYLNKYPDSQDTLEGITQWWILEQSIERMMIKVEKALSGLVEKGLVIELSRVGAQATYRINKDKASEIKILLSKKEGKEF